ncbi:MAG: ABC transporter ATP-binding protein [Thermoleophilia bacterium]|nr:ABC transporter ATP-binding protein [Thermoleophilia bacterium]MDH4347029.1 ABC transporter ATP-binding protein [Thermoleophilia bacterium]MDH5333656.1 ABC transporter ATP-binding protein [Thermoleophilia bacterium]
MACSAILLDGVSKRYGDVLAVDRASLCVDRGHVVALLGPSGCGKTTLLRLIAGFERPDAGTIEVAGAAAAGPAICTPPERRPVGMVFQDYALFPHLTVADNVGFGLRRAERPTRVPMLLALVGLCGLGDRYPHELSGGQQQRVALARALAPAPDIVLLDEPWSNVDPHLREELRSEVTGILRPLGVTVLLVTHDREEAFSVADRVALVHEGTIVQEGTAEELYFNPASRWAAEFVGTGNVLRGHVQDGLVRTTLGTFPANGASGADEVEVLIRPELLELSPDPEGNGEVVRREFRGHDVFYRVLLDGVELLSHRPSTEVVPLGARVAIRLHEGHVPVFH